MKVLNLDTAKRNYQQNKRPIEGEGNLSAILQRGG